ncbi:hypothetical protein TELCIR_09133 [Teladorsagia circumcincta]|uniref:DEAD-box helicase OB fold domain-containing protein n=1 Tax=Teladorsagia circumcincta TaxID=45464 RepID=A0A2G9UFN9_TELCI|nr:hypothetical protein TELCIR_09133 [Teladorsagia circumcincta]
MSEEREQSNRQRDSFGKRDFSDHITLIRAFNEFNEKSPKEAMLFCRANYLSLPAMRMIAGIRRQLLIELRRVRMISYEGDALNALRDATYNRTEAAATLHPSSVIKRQVLAASKRSEVINQYVAEDSEDPVIEYLAFHELAKIDEGLTLRTVTVVPPCAVVLFAGSMRLKKSTIQNFDITDPESGDEVDIDEEGPRDVVYPIEHWIGVRATYPDMKRLIQLRFKVMSYFLAAIHKPQLLTNPQKEDLDLLETLALVLKTDHQQMKFNTCVLPEQQFIFQQHQVPTSSSTSSYSSHNGQAAALRFSHREGTSSQPNMSALAEVPPKSALGASNSEALPPSHSAANFQAGGYEDNDPPDGNRSPPPVQQERDPQDRYVGQRQQPRRQLSAQDDYAYQKNRRDNYDPRRFARNRDDWQRNRPYQPREGFRDKVERAQNFRDRERERNARDETGPGPSSQQQQLPRQRIQGYNNRDRDYRQNDREWSRGEQISDSIRSDLDQLTWQQREMERNDNYRDRQGRRDYNYRQRQYTKYDDDREEPVPEDPRVDRTDEDGWGEAEYQAAGYHHDQQDHQHKHNRQYHRPYNRGGYRGRSRGYFNNRQNHYNRDDGRREMQDGERGDRDSGDNKDHELNSRNNDRGFYRQGGGKNYDNNRSRNNDRGFYRQGGGKNYDNNRSIDHDREKHSEKSRVFYNSNKNPYSGRI